MEAAQRHVPGTIPWVKKLTVPGIVTPEILAHEWEGKGSRGSPYLVTFFDNDPVDPLQFPSSLQWTLCVAAGYVTFSVAFISSAYASGIPGISRDLGGSAESTTLGLSLFVLGFVFGPLIWGPTSGEHAYTFSLDNGTDTVTELFGRRYISIISTIIHVALNVAICFCQSLVPLLVLRLLSGAFGAAPLTNSGGIIADTFPPKTRGLAITVYALVPLFAPVLGPIIGGFVADAFGWRWLMGLMALLSASALTVSIFGLPETYAPVLLRKRAENLSNMTGAVYVSAMAAKSGGKPQFTKSLATTLSRPFILAVHEPIILCLALYQAVVFGILYLTFAAFPIVYGNRGWSPGLSGLSFLGVLVGTLSSVIYQIWDNRRYVRLLNEMAPEPAPPEARLLGCCVGSVSIVVGLFWFAWTNGPNTHAFISIAAGIPFGFGVVLVTIGSTNYLVDSYTVYAASALTVCICGRAVLGATFPLFARGIYERLGVHWGSSIPALLALLCTPFPFAFYRYGPDIRARCKYAGKAEKALQRATRPRANNGDAKSDTQPLLETQSSIKSYSIRK